MSEAAFDQFIGRVEIAAEVVWQQHKADHDPPDDISHDHLQEGEIGIVSKSRDADNRQSAGFGGDDGESDRPPGNLASGEEVIAQGALLFAETKAEERDPRQINRDDGEIESVQAHAEIRSPTTKDKVHEEAITTLTIFASYVATRIAARSNSDTAPKAPLTEN